MVLQEAGNTELALDHLDTYQHQICDKVTLLETRAKYYMQIQKTTDSEESKKLQIKAADIYKGLIKRNPENHAYYTKLAESMEVKNEESQLAMYAEYRKMFPKAQAPQRLPMNFAQGKWAQLYYRWVSRRTWGWGNFLPARDFEYNLRHNDTLHKYFRGIFP